MSGQTKRSASVQLPVQHKSDIARFKSAPACCSRRSNSEDSKHFLTTTIRKKHWNRLKNKKRDGTPEKSTTPSQDVSDENRPPSMNVIWNEDIEKLQIKHEEIQKLHDPRPPSERKSTPVIKNVSIRKVRPPSEPGKPQPLNVTVAKPAPEDAPLKPINYTGYAGPRYNYNGDVLSHSILGGFEEFHNEAVKRGDFINVETPTLDLDQSDKPTVKYEKKRPRSQKTRRQAEENNALINWQLKMIERKKQQGYISKLLQVPPEDLVMNQGDNYRVLQEKRDVIEKTIPAIDYGKGYRVGSEFWNQQKLLGDNINGIHMSLKDTEKGIGPPVQHIGIPQSVRKEKGWTWAEDHHTEVHYPWHKTPYLSSRVKQLQPYMNELDPHQPEFAGLEIIGSNRPLQTTVDVDSDTDWTEIQAESETEDTIVDPLSEHPDVHPAPIFGPSIQFAGQPARWTGDSHSFKNEMGVEARVTFESYTNERITSYLEIINDGTTSIYYDWKKLDNDNPFELVKSSHIQRFYFNNSSGVVLPGETMKFPFVFKSPNAGVFSEQWLFETRPVVCGGAALVVTLRGVALQEDVYKKHREIIEQDLQDKQACQVVKYLLYELIDGIRTPERCRSPIDAYITEEDTFTRLNHGVCYKYEQVEELKRIYKQLFTLEERDTADWDLSLDTLKEKILELSEDDELKEPMLNQVSLAVNKMSFIPTLPVREEMEKLAYNHLSEALDNMCGYSIYLRQTIGLPDKDFNDSSDTKETEIPAPLLDQPVINKKKGKVRAGRLGSGETDLPVASDKRSKSVEKPKVEPKQDKKVTPTKEVKGTKGAKELPKPVESKGKITPAPKKTPSRIDAITPIGENSLTPTPSPTPTFDSVVDKKYKEKLYSMTYLILGDLTSKIQNICDDVRRDRVLRL